MLLFLLGFLSFLLLSKSIKAQPIAMLHSRMWAFPRILFIILKEFHKILGRKRSFLKGILDVPRQFPLENTPVRPRFEIFNGIVKENEVPLLDLPDLVLGCILEKLSPADLCVLSLVCSSLGEKCSSDYVWEKHFQKKWGGVFGEAAWKQWGNYISSNRSPKLPHCKQQSCRSKLLPLGSFFVRKPRHEKKESSESRSTSMGNSVLSLYAALETGKFWFPAQVHDREVKNGYLGFSLSCYDALLCYDSAADSFIARYPCQGRSVIEDDVKWHRIRCPPVHVPSSAVHISRCLEELNPDDHIEIQWRKNPQFPYGWWYGIVGHLDTCSGNTLTCQCHISDTVVLEFRQYASESRWRRTELNTKHQGEVGSKGVGFYGGIRKIHEKEEIAKWQSFWPDCNTTLR